MNDNPGIQSQDNNRPPIDWMSKRIAPHWSLLVAALVTWAFLLDMIRPILSPLLMSVAILILLYPSRRIRAIKPLLFLAMVTASISIWWRLSSLLTPFIIAFFLAYAFEPVIERAEKMHIPRLVAVLVLMFGLTGVLVVTGILVFPKLLEEVGALAMAVPDWITLIRLWTTDELLPWAAKMNIPTDQIWREVQPRLPSIFKTLMGGLAEWGAQAASGAMSLLTGLANLILIPVLTIYFMNDFLKLRSWTYRIFPDNFKEDALKAYHQLNESISAFVRGQLLVCLFLATWIGGGLAIFVHLPYSILIGAAAGLLNLIPYVGTTTALVVTIAVSMFQENPIMTAVKALIIFTSGQTLEANLLTPRIVGDKVGLHPIVVIFIVLLFATYFGLVGMLVAIPVGAAAKVLWLIWQERQRRNAANFLSSASET